MKPILIAMFILTAALVTVAPSASAAPPGLCDLVKNTMCHVPGQLVQDAKDMVEDLDPRNWPCTCDPMPNPLGP